MEFSFQLHDQQLAIANSNARFKVCSAGRRGGKSYYACISLLMEGMKNEKNGYDLAAKEIFYVSPTFDQSKRNVWDLLKILGGYGTKKSIISMAWENTGIIQLVNGRKIELKGADRPDTLRGVGLSYVVLDEYAFMKPTVWEQVLLPTLSDVEGDALFIGTPDGKNHFFDLFKYASEEGDPEWEAFTFRSIDNPTLNAKDIEKARKRMSSSNFKQEYEASFSAGGGAVFREEYFQYMDEEPDGGEWYIAVDPSGYADLETTTQGKLNTLDECAIACVKVGPYGWYVGDIYHGRWGVRETATRILRAAQKFKAMAVGIEKGSLKNAMIPYLTDEMMRLSTFPSIKEVTHGSQKKSDRIAWALEGRFEHSRIWFRKDAGWLSHLEGQLLDFPNPLSRDDLIDALAYIDQVASTDWEEMEDAQEDDWEDLEDVGRSYATGY